MKAALITCPAWDQTFPTVSAALLSACLKARGHEAVFFDLNKRLWLESPQTYLEHPWGDLAGIEASLAQKPEPWLDKALEEILATGAGLIGFCVFASNAGISMALTSRLKRLDPSRFVVFGGVSCFEPAKCRQYLAQAPIDAAVCGEGELAFPALATALERSLPPETVPGVVTRRGGDSPAELARALPVDLDALPTPDFGVYDLEGYASRVLTLDTSRGCVRRCVFCDDWQRLRYRQKSAGRILAQMRELLQQHPKTTGFLFADSLVNGDMRQLEGLADRLIGERLDTQWSGWAIVRPEMTPRLLDKLRASGCRQLFIGIETGSDEVSVAMNKLVDGRLKSRVLSDAKRAGISSTISVIVGFPTETEDDFEGTVRFVEANAGAIGHMIVALCDISHMREPERYGIRKGGHHVFWETADGGNTLPIRLARLRRLADAARRSGVDVSFAIQQADFGKRGGLGLDYCCETLLARYHFHRGDPLEGAAHQHTARRLILQSS